MNPVLDKRQLSLAVPASEIPPRLSIIVSNRYRLAYVPVPKCASTSLIGIFARLHGLPVDHPRRALPRLSLEEPASREVGRIRLARDELPAALDRFADYTWFSVVRDPHERLRSAYNNKLNRFAKRFRPASYWAAKLRHILMGVSRWADSTATAPFLQARISYGEFLDTLLEKGLGWDSHYRPQSDQLRLDRIAYSKLIKIEAFGAEMADLLRKAGVSKEMIAGLDLGRRANSSGEALSVRAALNPAEREKSYRLYAADFARLGYEK